MKSVVAALSLGLLLGCGPAPKPDSRKAPRTSSQPQLELVAESRAQWTGIAVSRSGRIFVNFPRWSDSVPISVAELLPGGQLKAYPNPKLNGWKAGLSPGDHFVCVQAMFVDSRDRLWILDPANPRFRGVVKGGAKLMQVDLEKNRIVRTILIPPSVAPARSYLNDVRVDVRTETAYITESGLGAIVVVDLATGTSRRLLHAHRSTKAEGITLTIGGKPWKRGGRAPQVHADGIALHPTGKWLYWQALSGRTLYRVETRHLRSTGLSPKALGNHVQRVATVGASDGIVFDRRGNLYLSSLEHDAVRRWTVAGKLETVVKSARIAWPDSFALGPKGWLYFTTAQIHRLPSPPDPYRVFKIRLP